MCAPSPTTRGANDGNDVHIINRKTFKLAPWSDLLFLCADMGADDSDDDDEEQDEDDEDDEDEEAAEEEEEEEEEAEEEEKEKETEERGRTSTKKHVQKRNAKR